MNTLFITGGAGFIGGCLVRQLVTRGECRVINFDNLTYAGNLESLETIEGKPNYHFVRGDIAERRTVAALFEQFKPTAVINLAAETHVDRSIDAPDAFVQTNVVGTYQLLEAARAYWNGLAADAQNRFRFLQVSTDEVYGSLGATGKFTETTSYAPSSPYSASKAAADHFVRAYHETYGLPTLITNCSNNYGPFQFPEKLIPLMILNAVEGRPLPIYGDGNNVRDWLHVEDHCRAIQAVVDCGRPGHVYNIGGSCERTNRQVVQTICDVVDQVVPGDRSHSELVAFVPDRPGHDRRYAIDSAKIQAELDWQPTHSFEHGIEQTVRWYIENRDWVERIESKEYSRDRLGLK